VTDFPFGVVLLGGAGVVAGLVLLARGFSSFGRATLIADTTVSRISSLAVGEVAVSGTIEAAEVTLIAPITSEPCVYYRARIDRRSGDSEGSSFNEERAVGFTIRDAGGAIRVFPRGARFDIPDDLDARTGTFGETPPGVRLRHGPSSVATDLDREAMVAQLLTVRPAARFPGGGVAGAGRGIGAGIGVSDVRGAGLGGGARGAQDRNREAGRRSRSPRDSCPSAHRD
jgi:hypothetical protein